MKKINYKKAVLALIIANIIWGAASPIFKWSLEGISPLNLAFFRYFVAFLCMLPFAKKAFSIRIKDIPTLVLMGLLNTTFNVGLYFIGLAYTASINQPVISSAGPIFVIVASYLFLRDKVSQKVLLGNMIGLTGVLFIVIEPLLYTHQHASFLGNLLFVFSTIAGSMGTIVSKKLTDKYKPSVLLFWNFLIATLSFMLVPIDEITASKPIFLVNIHSIVGILFGAIFTSVIGYFLFYWGLKHIKASETTIFSYVDPLAALLIAMPLLHEYPTPVFLFGSFLIFFGIYVAEGRLQWHPVHKLLS